MLSFEHHAFFALLPLPLIVGYLFRHNSANLQVLQVPSLKQWAISEQSKTNPAKTNSQWLALIAVWLLLIVAAANPVWYGEPVEQQAEGRDILLAVDISGSMKMADMSLGGRWVDRLTATKAVISEFVAQRQNDRLGLILYGSNAYMHVPLTRDTQTLITLLNEAQIGFAGNETAIGDAIGLGIKRLRDLGHDQRIMILLTDGNNSAGSLEPLEAAKLAAEDNLKIYAIGVGSRQGLRASFGLGRNDIDSSTLNEIARITGGQAFRAAETNELNKIYQYIDSLEPTPDTAESIRPQRSLSWYALAAAMLMTLLVFGIQPLLLRWLR